MSELAGALAAFFLWGLTRGLSTCLFLCAPGMIPLIVNEKAGLARSLWFGLLLSLPRILILTALGALAGFLSFEVLSAAPIRGAMTWVSLGAYVVLGLLLVLVGARLLSSYGLGEEAPGTGGETKGPSGGQDRKAKRAAKGKGHAASQGECPSERGEHGGAEPHGSTAWARLWGAIGRRLYPEKGKGASLFLLWGGVLSMACLAELGLLEGAAVGALAGSGSSAALSSAGFGAAMMLVLSLGATVPIMAAAAVGGELVEKMKDKKRLELVRGVSAMLMVLLGLYFILMEAYKVLVLAGIY